MTSTLLTGFPQNLVSSRMTTNENNNEGTNAPDKAFTEAEKAALFAENAAIRAHVEQQIKEAQEARIEKLENEGNERITTIPPSQIEMLRTAAVRLRQSGKTSLAKGLEQIVSDYGAGQPVKMVIPALNSPQEALVSAPRVKAPNDLSDDLSDLPAYVPENGEVDDLTAIIRARLNALLTGPTGCGKTHLVQHVAKKLNRPVYTIQGGAGATFERIVAKDALESAPSGATITVRPSANAPQTWSVLPRAMADSRGGILYLDEPNGTPNDVLFYLFSAMDHRRTITFDDGTSLKAHPDFVVVGAMNEGYSGTGLLNAAFRDRSEVLDMHYLPKAREIKLLVSRHGIDKELAQKLVMVAHDLRAARSTKAIKTDIGTRSLLACAKLINEGMAVKSALTCSVVNKVPSQFLNERKAVTDIIAAYFGTI